MNTAQQERAGAFRRLHHGTSILVLPNAWDAGSALVIESCGAAAIATTSAGVAWSHGYPDGDALPINLLLNTIADIVRVMRVPLTVDAEGGYATDPGAVGETIARVIDAGAVGINIEDGKGAPEALCQKLDAIRKVAARSGVDLYVNARIDVYLRGLVPAGEALNETLARAKRYADSGCDGIFVPGVTDEETIQKLASGVRLPLNVLARGGMPSAKQLETLGVRRLSSGSAIAVNVLGRARSLASEFLKGGRSEIFQGEMQSSEANTLIAKASDARV